MKTRLNASLVLLVVSLSLNALDAVGQTIEPSGPKTTKSDKGTKAADFAAKEKAMQDLSRSSAAGAVASVPVTEATPYNKDKNAGKAAADEAMGILSFKGSKPVDKNAKAVAPIKSISKMTIEEREEVWNEVAKEAKP